MQQFRTTSVRAVIRDGSNILVEWFSPKSISFLPGGTIEQNEDIRAALARELSEEIAEVKFEIGGYLGKIGHTWRTSQGSDSCLNHFYEATIISGDQPRSNEPGRELRWISLESNDFNTLQPPKLRALLLGERPVAQWDFVDSEI